jgi:hypothetical protein
MTIKNCPKCGGDHYGSFECPFILAPCIICGIDTILACADCAIEGRSVHVCEKSECRNTHESKQHGDGS